MIHIRECDPGDISQVERCISELQVFERALEPNRADPASISAPYLAHLLQQCREQDGAIFVAEAGGAIVGFVCILARVDSGSMIEVEREYAYISDLVVLPAQRGQGIGRALLKRAEEFAARRGAAVLKAELRFCERYVSRSETVCDSARRPRVVNTPTRCIIARATHSSRFSVLTRISWRLSNPYSTPARTSSGPTPKPTSG
jgi:GNAT superfamily N-acetyltransferase